MQEDIKEFAAALMIKLATGERLTPADRHNIINLFELFVTVLECMRVENGKLLQLVPPHLHPPRIPVEFKPMMTPRRRR